MRDQHRRQRPRGRESAVDQAGGADFGELAEIIKKAAFKITRVGQLVAMEASRRLGVPFGIIDLSLAPTPGVGDSVARILEGMGLETCGIPGTTAALAMLNDAVKKGGTMASSSVGGLSGAFIPVSEDEGYDRGGRSRGSHTGKTGGHERRSARSGSIWSRFRATPTPP